MIEIAVDFALEILCQPVQALDTVAYVTVIAIAAVIRAAPLIVSILRRPNDGNEQRQHARQQTKFDELSVHLHFSLPSFECAPRASNARQLSNHRAVSCFRGIEQ